MKKTFTSGNKLQGLIALAVTSIFTACAGGTPAVETDVNVKDAPEKTPTETTAKALTPTETETQTSAPEAKQNSPETTPEIQQETKEEVPQAEPEQKADSAAVDVFDSNKVQKLEQNTPAVEKEEAKVIDPYQEFPTLASQVFEYADTLYAQGKVDEAVAYLERFRIIKPLWNQWEQTADSMLQEFGKTNAELAKQFEPLVLEIINMNRVQTAYSMVQETADSLISLAPGDSLTRFANEQKKIAYDNTLRRAQKEMALIKAMADQNAKFAEAEQRALEFQMRYRDFEESLKIQALVDYIRGLSQATDAEATKYWETNDPAIAMKKAGELIAQKKYAEAKELLTKLKASSLRKEAMEKYVTLADEFCNTKRKETSQLFNKAQKQKDDGKKKELLQSAIDSLDKCISEYPESTLNQKVVDNRNFLLKELSK